MRKLLACMFMIMLLAAISFTCVSAEGVQDISIEMQIGQNDAVVNGEICKIDENESVTPYVENDRTLVPLRFVAEVLNLQVNWAEETQTVTLMDESAEIIFQIDERSALVNGDAYTLDVCPVVESDRTFVPVRFVSEALWCKVQWDEESQTVTIKRTGNYLEQKHAAERLAELEVVKPEFFENRESIMEGDCLAILCRSIGVMVDRLGYSGGDYGMPEIRKRGSSDDNDFILKGVYAAGSGAGAGLITTHLLDGRLPGASEPLHSSYSRCATTKKAIAYMMRCLKNPELDLTDEDAMWNRALEIGMIKETDAFAIDPDSQISPEDFFVLMYRFVQQPRYYYFDSVNRDYTAGADLCYMYYNGDDETYEAYLERIVPILKESGKFRHKTNKNLEQE